MEQQQTKTSAEVIAAIGKYPNAIIDIPHRAGHCSTGLAPQNNHTTTMIHELQEAVNKYGWSAAIRDSTVLLFNRKGTQVVNVTIGLKKGAYRFCDTSGNTLLMCKGHIAKGATKLLTQYYHCQEL